MTVLLFGRLADMLGRQVELDLPRPCSVGDIRREIARGHPDCAGEIGPSRARACLNQVLAGEDMIVWQDDEIAFLPPLSGG